MSTVSVPRLARAYYAATLAQLKRTSDEAVIGSLALAHGFSLEEAQRSAWLHEVRFFRELLGLDDAYLMLEYHIPRMGKRIDAVLIHAGHVFAIEFKVGETSYTADALDQILDYALDLKDFHAASRSVPIVPVLLATHAPAKKNTYSVYPDGLWKPLVANARSFAGLLHDITTSAQAPSIDARAWSEAAYRPTPTIIEAAQALYRGHQVTDISRSEADNLSATTDAVSRIIEHAKHRERKAICFVTGVPGSGKTLAGLNLATQRWRTDQQEHAVFLSGNGPLVRVLQEALARDRVASSEEKLSKRQALSETRAFIQNVHHFRDDALQSLMAPIEKVVIFDEAQRAWDATQTSKFMQQKRGLIDFDQSEPEFLMEVMDRHDVWAVIVCLVGGGQEINTGEAGLPEWFQALSSRFRHWDMYVSNVLGEEEYSQGVMSFASLAAGQPIIDPDLHLGVSLRSFRSENLSAFVKALLDLDQASARELWTEIGNNYPIVLTRDLALAKRWVRDHTRGSERSGLLASSGALRLRPYGIDVKHEIEPEYYFLNPPTDVRSSCALEDVATEFDAQGLELDWSIVGWDADLRMHNGVWHHHAFRGTRWQAIRDSTRQRYLKNAYRVLLTRARQGMAIFVPPGDPMDATRTPAYYDGTWAYLCGLGLPTIDGQYDPPGQASE